MRSWIVNPALAGVVCRRYASSQAEDVVGALEPCPDERTRQDGESEVVVDTEVEGLDDGTANTNDERGRDEAENARVEDRPVVVHGRTVAPEDHADKESGYGRGKEAGQGLARRKRKELDAGEVCGERGRVSAPQAAKRRCSRVRP